MLVNLTKTSKKATLRFYKILYILHMTVRCISVTLYLFLFLTRPDQLYRLRLKKVMKSINEYGHMELQLNVIEYTFESTRYR